MSRILAEVAGKLATWLGYDGTDFRNVHVDAAGDLQVDVLTTAINVLAATAAHQVTMITALELIDDLRAALDSVGTDELDVNVEASVLPTGASTAAIQATLLTALQSIQNLVGALNDVGVDELRVLAGKTGATWKALPVSAANELETKVVSSVLPTGAGTSDNQTALIAKFQDQVFTYKGQVCSKAVHVKSGAGHYTLLGDAVPEGEIWVLTNIMAYNWDTANGAVYVGLDQGGVQYWGAGTGTIAAKAAWQIFTPMYLVHLDKPAAYFYACLDGDNLALFWNGYSMTLAP